MYVTAKNQTVNIVWFLPDAVVLKNNINIAEMSLGRIKKGRKMLAMTVINTDSDVPKKVLTQIEKLEPILEAKVFALWTQF